MVKPSILKFIRKVKFTALNLLFVQLKSLYNRISNINLLIKPNVAI